MIKGNHFLFLLVLFTISLGCQEKNSDSGLKDQFRWISGQWKGVNGSVEMIERWKWNKSRYEGEGYEIRDGDTIFSERLFIESFDGVPSYVASLPKSGTTMFQGQLLSEGVWKFENPNHDFPSIIQYEQEGDSALIITLLAKGEPYKGEHSFQLKRMKQL